VGDRNDRDDLVPLGRIQAEFGIAPSTIYRYRRRGELIPLKVVGDRRTYYRRSELEALTKPRPKVPVTS